LIVVVVLIALAIDAPKTLLAATVLYALSGPLLWLRRRKPPPQDAAG
jgi:CDP-diacylglycerol--serine O-phosphatidyltransferase